MPSTHFDLAIIGAGPVGLALAGWLARRSATRARSIALIDARDAQDLSATVNDPRALTLSEGSRMLLEPLSWPTTTTPIQRIHISQRGYFGRMLIDHREYHYRALGYVMRYGVLVSALAKAVPPGLIHWFKHCAAGTPTQDANGVTLPLHTHAYAQHAHSEGHGAHRLRTQLLINAEGGLFTTQSPRPIRRDYQQTALIGMVTVDAPQANVAWECFTSDGPLALLPLGGARNADYALVWCAPPGNAQRRLLLNDDAFLAELGAAFGTRMGRFISVTGRTLFPLGLNALDTMVDRRIVALGNAAQTLHPVAGQGLNLGLRDAYLLSDAFSLAGVTPTALTDFEQRRQADRRFTINMTDKLARAFTASTAKPKHAPYATPILRGLALAALDCVAPLKRALMRKMIFGQRY